MSEEAIAPTDENLAQEVAKLDINESESSTAETTTTDSSSGDEPKTMKGMIKVMNEHSNGTNVIKESITTFTSMDGVEKKGDIVIDAADIESKGLPLLKEMIQDAKDKNEKLPEAKRSIKWEFETSPHEQFGKTLDDLYMAFLKWARKNKKKEDKKKKKKKSKEEEEEATATEASQQPKILNVNKAFRRLESYAEWMDQSKEDLKEGLNYEGIKKALSVWGMNSSISKDNQYIWWLDFKKIEKKVTKEVPVEDTFRSFVWYSHFMMYNSNAQDYGLAIIESCEGLTFLKMVTLFPMNLGVKLDRLTMGVLPVKMDKVVILESPTWMTIFMNFLKAFMSKKMRNRIMIMKEWDALTPMVGEECVPKDFGKVEGNENYVDLLNQFVDASK